MLDIGELIVIQGSEEVANELPHIREELNLMIGLLSILESPENHDVSIASTLVPRVEDIRSLLKPIIQIYSRDIDSVDCMLAALAHTFEEFINLRKKMGELIPNDEEPIIKLFGGEVLLDKYGHILIL